MLLHWEGSTCLWGTTVAFFWRDEVVNSEFGAGVQETIKFHLDL